MEILFLVGIFIWLIILENRVRDLSDKNEHLEKELHSYETLLESIEHEMEDNYCRMQSSSNVSQKAASSAQFPKPNNINTQTENISKVQESISINQTEQTKEVSSINEALSIVKQRTDTKLEKSLPPLETSSNNTKKTIITDKAVEHETTQNTYKETAVSQVKSPTPQTPQPPKEPISFVQLFSWIGGFILLLGIIFWIKYALENNIISPDMRVALGTIAGIGLWIVGALLKKPEVKTTSDTLCACGLCACYSAWFAAYYFYHIIPASLTFVLLSLVALASFATAIWKKAQYIGVLAQVIGFVTPFLFPFDSNQIWFLLAYAAIINVAAVASALKCDWPHQIYTGLAFTFLSFLGIINASDPLQLSLFAGVFVLLYTGVAASQNKKELMHCSFVFAFVALLILSIRSNYIKYDSIPYVIAFATFFSMIFGILSSWKKNNELGFATLGFAFTAFILVAYTGSVKALLAFMAFIMLFFGILTTKMKQPYMQVGTIVLASLGSIVLFIEQLSTHIDHEYLPYYAGFVVFFTIFFGIIAFIQKSGTLLINTIVFSLICYTMLLQFNGCQPYVLSIAALFTLFFGILAHKMNNRQSQYTSIGFTTACSVLMSITTIINLGFTKFGVNISTNWIMAYAMSAVVFYFYISAKEKNGILYTLSSISLVFPLLLLVIHEHSQNNSVEMLYWLFAWSGLITIAIIFLKKYFDTDQSAWITTIICNIIAAVTIGTLCNNLEEHIRIASGSSSIIISIIFAYLIYYFIKSCNLEDEKDKFQISCLICAPITFITLAITLHSTNEWETMAFAFEGLSLIMLWHYLKIDNIQNIGFGLMIVVAVRLLFNPFIENYYPQTQVIFNWYLYTYVICAAMLLIGSYLWRNKDDPNQIPQIMRVISGIIIVALINIEIANYFAKGKGLSFNFCGGLAEAAAYTIAWALYGAICMFNSSPKNRLPLKVGIGLISLALLKLFLSDIWNLSSGLRIVVLIGVAIILLTVSFIYQQFKKLKERVE